MTIHNSNARPDHVYMTVAEVAEMFRVSRDCVYRAIKQGDLRHKAFTRRAIRIHFDDAMLWFYSENK